ncbi:MAG: hypothetical protein VKL42_06915 [Snowella sp.]|nr:hypothetical protein [Snowella sp.]
MAIPSFDTNGHLPAGIHLATWQEVEETLAFNPRRQELLSGLKRACESLKEVGCLRIFISGSFATNKEFPGDFDVCWADENVDLEKLAEIDPVLLGRQEGLKVLCGKDYSKKKKDKILCKTVQCSSKRT